MGATTTTTKDALAELRTRLERLENENAVLVSATAHLTRRLDELEAERKAELADYERREAALYEFAKALPAPAEPDTDDPWEIARQAGEQLTPEGIETFFDED